MSTLYFHFPKLYHSLETIISSNKQTQPTSVITSPNHPKSCIQPKIKTTELNNFKKEVILKQAGIKFPYTLKRHVMSDPNFDTNNSMDSDEITSSRSTTHVPFNRSNSESTGSNWSNNKFPSNAISNHVSNNQRIEVPVHVYRYKPKKQAGNAGSTGTGSDSHPLANISSVVINGRMFLKGSIIKFEEKATKKILTKTVQAINREDVLMTDGTVQKYEDYGDKYSLVT